MASSFSGNFTGNYLVNLARIPADFFVAPGDEGGTLVSGVSQNGVIDKGDMDLWRFASCLGRPLSLSCQKLSGTSFSPRLRLYARNGALLATAVNPSVAIINFSVTNSGFYTVIVDGGNVSDSGTYTLSGNGLSDELSLCLPLISGTNLTLGGLGGTAGATFVLFTTTNVATPAALWTPILTNQFDQFGVFNYMTTNAAERQRYFLLRSP